MDKAKKIIPDIHYCDGPYQVAEGSEALLICTEWDEFKTLDLEKVKKAMTIPIVFDGRNVYSPDAMRTLGFQYISIGRP